MTLEYKDRGDGPPLIGVMGFALDQRFWGAQIPAITPTHRFITFDNRGIGGSTGDMVSSIDQMAHDTIRLMDHLAIDKAVIMGASMGGTIAQRIVLDHPERVSALILAITWARPIEFMRRQHELGKLVAQVGGNEALMRATLVRMFTPRFFEMGAEAVDLVTKAFLEDGPELPSPDLLTAQIDALEKHDALADLGRIDVPTLVIGAKFDQMVPYLGSEEIAAAIPGAEFASFESGHGVMVEEMQAFNDRLARFLQNL